MVGWIMADGKWISDLTRTTPVADAARRVLAVRLEVVRDHLRLALRHPEQDPEHVHQLRVGTRRAGAALRIFALCLPDKIHREARRYLRKLRRAAGQARDWDVFLLELTDWKPAKSSRRHQAGLDFLAGYGLSQRVGAQAHLEAACPDYPFDFERFLAETVAAVHKPHSYTEVRTLLDLARPMLARLLHDLDDAGAADLEDYDNLHQVRIVGKRLRYAMEVFAACFEPAFRETIYPAIEQMQDILGQANDSHVASQRLRTLGDSIQAFRSQDWKRFKPGIEGLIHYHDKRLPLDREQFLEWWTQWQEGGGKAALAAMLSAAESRVARLIPVISSAPASEESGLVAQQPPAELPAPPEPATDSRAG
jgi:CHAD domain-containing protein